MRRMIPIRLLAVSVLLFAAAGCARSVAVESDPAPGYAIEVDNPMPHPMIVSYRDGSGVHLLGTVPAGSRDRFVIAGADRGSVTIVATDEDETHTVEKVVQLVRGETVPVRLRP